MSSLVNSCPYFDTSTCRSCSLLPLPYDQQLEQKRSVVAEALAEAGINLKVEACIGCEPALHSRNKAKMVVGGSAEHPKLGIIDAGQRVRDLTACPLLLPEMLPFLRALRDGLAKFSIAPYAVPERSGELKYCILRQSEATGEMLLRLVAKSDKQRPQLLKLATFLQESFPLLKVVSLNIQPVHQAILEGPEEHILSVESRISDNLAGFQFKISPQSFGQVTSKVADKLYRYVANTIERKSNAHALDLYCGVGAFSLAISSKFASVLGVESSPIAVSDAEVSAMLNSISNVSFEATDVEAWITKADLSQFSSVVVNPPRRGLAAELVKKLCEAPVETIIYSSCNPQTLARDLALLLAAYDCVSAQPFDMFPLTEHVETVVVLKRKE